MVPAPTLVLLMTDDPETGRGVQQALGLLPIEIEEASSSQELLRRAETLVPSLIIADLVLADMTGLGLCRLVREHPALERVPVMLLSARATEMDRIVAFEAGVDDFLAKPFYARELAARVKAILRRAQLPEGLGSVSTGIGHGLQLDADTGRVEVDGRRIDLTNREFEILSLLARYAGRMMKREQIVRLVWRGETVDLRVVDAHVKGIRRKLGDAQHLLETVRGLGFRLGSGERRGDSRARRVGATPSPALSGYAAD